MQELADLLGRLVAAEDTFAQAQAAVTDAEAEAEAASHRACGAKPGRARDEARAARGQALRKQRAARKAYDRATRAVARLQRRVEQTSSRLDRLTPLPHGVPRQPYSVMVWAQGRSRHGWAVLLAYRTSDTYERCGHNRRHQFTDRSEVAL